LCVDDNSSEEDRAKMKEKYPFFEFYFKTSAEKGHPQSMNIIKKKVTTPYIFHVEDDWKFFARRPYISECFDVLHSQPTIGQCLINKNYGETFEDTDILGGIPKTTQTGLRYLVHDYCPDINVFVKKYGAGKNCGYWPHFSFRPSLLRASIVDQLGDFNEKVSHFERDYCVRYVNAGYISAFLENIYCLHIGRLTSERGDTTKTNAYELNEEAQFSGKEEKIAAAAAATTPAVTTAVEKKETNVVKFKMFVVNMDRRPDRWEKFQKNVIGINYARYPAVDGSLLKPTPQLSRIFDSNDYNMRVGMVGCAMSHIKLYTDLIKQNFDFFVILEDDVETVPDFQAKLVKVLTTTPKNWDLIYLGHHLFPQNRTPDNYDKAKQPVAEKWSRQQSLANSMGGTGGYIISKKGAKKLLDFINRTGMTNCIDTMQQKSADELDVYYCSPHLIYSECFTGQNQGELDTDIQFNYDSLTVDINTRFVQELLFYKECNVQTIVDFAQMENHVKNSLTNRVLFYRDDENPVNIAKLQSLCIHPCYTLNNKILIVVSNPTEEQLTQRYFHRFQKNGEYDVSDALQYK
jgi:glycosyl transferase family 25